MSTLIRSPNRLTCLHALSRVILSSPIIEGTSRVLQGCGGGGGGVDSLIMHAVCLSESVYAYTEKYAKL